MSEPSSAHSPIPQSPIPPIMKRILLSMLCAFGCFAAQAQSYDYLIFLTTSGEQSVKAIGTVITFTDGNINVKATDAEFTLPLADLQKFFFSTEASAIELIGEEQHSDIMVYTVSGQFIGRFVDQRTVETQLPKGIYVTKGNGETKKMMVK